MNKKFVLLSAFAVLGCGVLVSSLLMAQTKQQEAKAGPNMEPSLTGDGVCSIPKSAGTLKQASILDRTEVMLTFEDGKGTIRLYRHWRIANSNRNDPLALMATGGKKEGCYYEFRFDRH